MTKQTIPKEWWKGSYFFGRRYFEPDNSDEGYIPGKKETLEERTKREGEGIIDLLKLKEGSNVVDVPCGYGRHSIYLASKGHNVTGLDIDKEHLEKAVIDSSNKDVKVNFLERDMRNIGEDLYGKYDALVNMFYSFGFFEKEEDNVQTMKEFYSALKEGGQMLIHTDVSPEMIKNQTTQTDAVRVLPDGNKLVILEMYNAENKRMEGSWETTDGIGRVIHPRSFYSVRIYTKDEFVDMAKNCGFKDVNVYGSFKGEKFDYNSKEMIVVGKK